MVSYYQIAGKQVGSHYLAMAVLGSMAGIVTLSTRGGSAAKDSTPPINAKSPDEEKYIKEFMASIEGGKSGNNVDLTKKDAGR
ncbi:45027147-d7ab-4e58-b5eb-1938f72b8b3d [Sclerotinia trifoliorum]|uniref:45027147-d7ab-4e58-b5eb-1938f72b8b3d n=1 Tax=Sclerotinia trifoliorum TaxID=28548 RepID=A0A8H2W2U9_9HELO|nr:45027147-d7ab-4e58-b5eb-1938f72b8b3d [Sclerotinia trifoliorum]